MSATEERFSDDLYALSEILGKRSPDAQSHGFLGGEWGYGQDFRNETFMMHPYCWCERDDCEWCAGCECPETAFHYCVDGVEVGWDEWLAFYKREMGPRPTPQRSDEVNKRRTQTHDKLCRYCKGGFGNAPNFHHFASGVEIRWYKYIGRGMEANRDVTRKEWRTIVDECERSLSLGGSD